METRNRTNKWRRITRWSIATFAVGLVAGSITGLIDAGWASITSSLLSWAAIAGLVMLLVGAPKVFGGLAVGVTSLITGAVFFAIGSVMVAQVGSDMLLGVEFTRFSDPLYVIGAPLRTYGVLLLIIGGIMAAASYLRRVLKAVEGKSTAAK